MNYQHSSFLLTDREGGPGPVKMSLAELLVLVLLLVSLLILTSKHFMY